MENKRLKKFLLTALATSSAVFPAFDAAAVNFIGPIIGVNGKIEIKTSLANADTFQGIQHGGTHGTGIANDTIDNGANIYLVKPNVAPTSTSVELLFDTNQTVNVINAYGYAATVTVANKNAKSTDILNTTDKNAKDAVKVANNNVDLNPGGDATPGVTITFSAAGSYEVLPAANDISGLKKVDFANNAAIFIINSDSNLTVDANFISTGGNNGTIQISRDGVPTFNGTFAADADAINKIIIDAGKGAIFDTNVILADAAGLNLAGANSRAKIKTGKTLTGAVTATAVNEGILDLDGTVTGAIGTGGAELATVNFSGTGKAQGAVNAKNVNFTGGKAEDTVNAETVNILGDDNTITGILTATNLNLNNTAGSSSLTFGNTSTATNINFAATAREDMTLLAAGGAKALNGNTTLTNESRKLIIGGGANILTLNGTVDGSVADKGLLEITDKGVVTGNIGTGTKLATVNLSGGRAGAEVKATTVNVTGANNTITGVLAATNLNLSTAGVLTLTGGGAVNGTANFTAGGNLDVDNGALLTIGNLSVANTANAILSFTGAANVTTTNTTFSSSFASTLQIANTKTFTADKIDLNGTGDVTLTGVGGDAIFTIGTLNLNNNELEVSKLTFARIDLASRVTNLNIVGKNYTLNSGGIPITNLNLNNTHSSSLTIADVDLTAGNVNFNGVGQLTLVADAAARTLNGPVTLGQGSGRLIVGDGTQTLTLGHTVDGAVTNTGTLEITPKGKVTGAIGLTAAPKHVIFSGGKAALVKAGTIEVTDNGSEAGTIEAKILNFNNNADATFTLKADGNKAPVINFTGSGDFTLLGDGGAKTIEGNIKLNSTKTLILNGVSLTGKVDKDATGATGSGNLKLTGATVVTGAIGSTTTPLDAVTFAGGKAESTVRATMVDFNNGANIVTGALTADTLNIKTTADGSVEMNADTNAVIGDANLLSTGGKFTVSGGKKLDISGNLNLKNDGTAELILTNAGVWTADGVKFEGTNGDLTLTDGTIVTPKVSLNSSKKLILSGGIKFKEKPGNDSPLSVLSSVENGVGAKVVHKADAAGTLYNVDATNNNVTQIIGNAAQPYSAQLGKPNATLALGGTVEFEVARGVVVIPATPNGGTPLTGLNEGTVIDFNNKDAIFRISADGFNTSNGTFRSTGGNNGTIEIDANNVTLGGTFGDANTNQVANLLIKEGKGVSIATGAQFKTGVKFDGDRGTLTILQGARLLTTPVVDFNNKNSTFIINNPGLDLSQQFTSSHGYNGTIVVNAANITLSGGIVDVKALKVTDGNDVAINAAILFSEGAKLGENATLRVKSGKSFTGNIDALNLAGQGTVELDGGMITGNIGRNSQIATVNITGDNAENIVDGGIKAAAINFNSSKNFTSKALNTSVLNLNNTDSVTFAAGANMVADAGEIGTVNFSSSGELVFKAAGSSLPTVNTINLGGTGRFISETPIKPVAGQALTVHAKSNTASLGYRFSVDGELLYNIILDSGVTGFKQVIMDTASYTAASDVNTAVIFADDGTLSVKSGKQILNTVDSNDKLANGIIVYEGIANIGFDIGGTNPIKEIQLADTPNENTIANNVKLGQVIKFGTSLKQVLNVGDGCEIEKGVTFGAPDQNLVLGASTLNGITFTDDGQSVRVASGGMISINTMASSINDTSVTVNAGATVGSIGNATETGVNTFTANGGVTFTGNTYNADNFILNGGTSIFKAEKTGSILVMNLQTSNSAVLDLNQNRLSLKGADTSLAAGTTYIISPQDDVISIDDTIDDGRVGANQILQITSDGLSHFLTSRTVNELEQQGGAFSLPIAHEKQAAQFDVKGEGLATYFTSYDNKSKKLNVNIRLNDKVIGKSGHVIDADKPFGTEAVKMLLAAEEDQQQAAMKSASTDTAQTSTVMSENTVGQMVSMLNVIDNQASAVAAAGSEYNDMGISVFATPFMAQAKTKLNGSVAGNSSNLNGLSLGMTVGVNDDNSHLGLGVVLANSVTKFKDAKQGDKTKGETKALAIFGDHAFDNAIVAQAVVALGVTDYNATEARYTGAAKGKYTSKFASVLGRVGYNLIANENCKVMPYVGLRYDTYKDSAYSLDITNADNLQVSAKSTQKYIASIGAKLSGSIDQGSAYFAPFADVAFGYNFAKKAKAKVINLGNFNPDIAYADTDKTLVNGRFGVEAKMENGFNVTLGGGMDILGNKTTVYSGSLKLGYKF